MSDYDPDNGHDEFCEWKNYYRYPVAACQCAALAKARADEREKAAQEVEVEANAIVPSDSTEFFLHAEAARAHNRRTREGMLRAAEVVRKGKR